MSTTSASPRPQVTLPGQVHTADGPLDMSGMYVMHHAFRRDLDAFVAAVARTPVADGPTWRALSARWERFRVMLHEHHTIEDTTLWPPLLRHVASVDGARATLEAMQAEHTTIDPALARCGELFAAMAARPDDATRERLAAQLATVRDDLTRHLAHEETDALPLLQAHLPEAEWAASERAAQKSFGLRDVAFLVPWAATGLTPEARDRAFATAGPTFRLAYRLTRRRHARREALAFRHA
ncbi:hemerythrin domain-containing protein [Geodermatophilus sabuli]|uniref:Hemerythrin domain-containing protein n=1 Tax=Geodermatophilus sabuli TaxID=1564158 RepID=A0A7K3VZQ1_9ACTN|nr:hemerythrin domain-containing protein [Geodermatophilus sabuli]NEK57563.1 hemerythrin domain-containing protein [Geodermatophilus sabuli]